MHPWALGYSPAMPLTYDEAQRAIAAAHGQAVKIGVAVSVAIVDEGSLLIALGRMDRAFPLSPQIAEAKACSSICLHREGEALYQLHQERPAFFDVASKFARVPLVPGIGSRLFKRAGLVCGAIGVSGGKPDQDVECCEAALRTLAL